ncbi:hypothetical protein HPB50_004560 [Hyalomma asiaticum]|uniref:Uncharacterized protein n=1 Tax=Hyalomma asiaticum TaxID=266040 RepID=A0ACB7TEX4_HYAAI|nr:hypothetical protein HPB50_004560 [Hyalomma asiaticum]
MSSAAGPDPTKAAANLKTCLPREVWVEIFRHLDVETLLTVAEAVPELKCLALSPAVVERVTFEMTTDKRIITKFLLMARQEMV